MFFPKPRDTLPEKPSTFRDSSAKETDPTLQAFIISFLINHPVNKKQGRTSAP
jgi:hypothetical protein